VSFLDQDISFKCLDGISSVGDAVDFIVARVDKN